MRHFAHLAPDERERLFHVEPQEFTAHDDRELLAVALGATLYLPGTRPAIAADLVRRAGQGVTSAVVCLEDAIADRDVPAAEANLVAQVRSLAESGAARPLVFVRVRTPEQIGRVVAGLGEHAGALSGFVVPKFTEDRGSDFLDTVAQTSELTGHRYFVMPILESAEVIHRETRTDALVGIRRALDKHRERVLAVRIGATDLSSAYGIRRSRDLTIYDVLPVAQVIADVVNVLGRADDTGFVVTGSVWEYFEGQERLLKPLLRESPFIEHDERALRARLIRKALDGLIREIVLDKANGITGKTVIHPSHVPAVHALSVVTHEEYVDAAHVLGVEMSDGGVAASGYRNKMNEAKPHRAWAERTMLRARVFGVSGEDVSFVDLLGAGDPA